MQMSDYTDYEALQQVALDVPTFQRDHFCSECGLEISHGGSAPYCSHKCLIIHKRRIARLLNNSGDTFGAERWELHRSEAK